MGYQVRLAGRKGPPYNDGMRSPKPLSYVVVLIALACGGGPASPVAPSAAALASRIIVVTHTTGFRHDSIPVAESTIQQLGRDSGLFDVTFCRTADDVRRMLTPAALADTAGVVFANTTGNLGIPDLDAFLAWIAAGHGFVGIHSASDTYHDAPAYLAMLGNEFDKHGKQAEVEAVVEAPTHPAVSHLGARYRVFDEIYRFVRNNREGVTPLLTLDRYPADGLANAEQPGDLSLAWSKSHGTGRVFYTALGHRIELWADARFQQHVLGGIRSVLNR
jgi:type 1 glutamine amidotransferase